MTDITIKVVLGLIIYGALCFGFGLWAGQVIHAVNPSDEDSGEGGRL